MPQHRKAEPCHLDDLDQQVRLVVDSAYDGFWDWHIEEDYEYMSPRFWTMFGYDPEEKKHHPSEWKNIIFEEDLNDALETLKTHIESEGKHPYRQVVRYRHKNGSTVWVLCKGKIIEWSEDGRPLRMVGTHTDITELKNFQSNAIKNAKMAALGEMASGIAHEINNPLAIVQASADWIMRQKKVETYDKNEILKKVQVIVETSDRISAIIDGLKVYSVDSKNIDCEVVDLKEVFESTLSFCSRKLKSSGVQLIYESNSNVNVFCNKTLLSQVFLNLISNSIEAINQANPWIKVQTNENKDSYEILFSDNGGGISPDIVPNIMTPFFTTKPGGHGTGLGLSLSRGIVESFGGSIEFLSKEPNTTFKVTLLKSPPPK